MGEYKAARAVFLLSHLLPLRPRIAKRSSRAWASVATWLLVMRRPCG